MLSRLKNILAICLIVLVFIALLEASLCPPCRISFCYDLGCWVLENLDPDPDPPPALEARVPQLKTFPLG